jgi:hypothetical protein
VPFSHWNFTPASARSLSDSHESLASATRLGATSPAWLISRAEALA